ncbi:Cation-transporting P-type ATPase [Corchorus capsularis]|uniref:Cation-transporting P-type ATPase n=1 Tax=Corchorus capsularis TaxID=210143 RepID=A0A1R3I0K2_COCAP|nr:Cation-transporting P-type ATPase [Corchorus capsularis]
MSSTSSGNGLLNLEDVEAGAGPSKDNDHLDNENRHDDDDDADTSDPFDVPHTKNAPLEILKRWRQAALVLNASRRFRYTLDLRKEEEKERRKRMIRAHAQVIRAALLFKLAGEKQIGPPVALPIAVGEYNIGLEQLASMTRDHKLSALQQYSGVEGLSELLKTDLQTGISGDDADLLNRRNAFGSNTYPRKKGRSFWRFLWEAWQDLTLIILIISAGVSLGLGIKTEGLKEGWYDGGSIFFAVFIVIVVTATSDYRQSLQFQNLNEEKRNIQLEVPADGVLITGHSLAIDESSMTGESKIVHKDQKEPFLMAGCKVADGVGTMLVTGVGINTEWGLLMASISEDTGEETPLQVRLNGVATFIGVVGLVVAVSVLLVLLVRYFTGNTEDPDGTTQFIKGTTKFDDAFNDVVKIFTIAVTIVVVAVPEGLPLAVTLTLAYSMRKMMADKALAISQMTVVEAYVGKKKINPPADSSQLHSSVVSLLNEGVAMNSTGNVFVPKDGGDVEISGSPTEKAILSWAVKLGMKFDVVRSAFKVLHVFPFNSEKKRGGVAVQQSDSDSEVHIHWKGAAEMVLASCSGYLDKDGCLQSIDEEKEFFKAAIDEMAASSLRCVALAYRLFEKEKIPTDQESLSGWILPEDSLVLLAIVGIKLLWVNLIMDTLGALALATEPPTDNLMHRSPVGRREPLITNIMWRNLLIQALYQVTVLLTLNFLGLSILHLKDDSDRKHAVQVKNTLIFNAFVMCQIIIIEFLGNFTSTVRLNWRLWLVSLGIGIFSWPLAIVGKLIPVPKTPAAAYFTRPFKRYRRSRNASS